MERARLIAVMKRNEWDTAATADSLGVHRGTIYRWMRRLGIPLPRERRALPPVGADAWP